MQLTNELKYYTGFKCHTLYDFIENGQYKGQFEAQFDHGEFNGVILYTSFDSESEDGEFEWEKVEDKELFNWVKEKAIQDYNN